MADRKITTENAPSGVTAAAGFMAGAAMAAIKKADKRDVTVIYSTVPASAAGVFTLNKVKAAPVLLSIGRLASGKAQAVVVNSGNANACNGEQGMKDALAMAAEAAAVLNIPEEMVLVASTGVIGKKMPMDKVLPGVREAAGVVSPGGGSLAAQAIMTTDTYPKETQVRLQLGGKTVTIGGMAKGSGMIHPNMATLLGFITTDAAISDACLKQALRYAVERSFNMITVDGDTSTNDMVVIMANGMAGNEMIKDDSEDFRSFREALAQVCDKLAIDIARDGEGATKLIEVEVRNAGTERDARLAAKAVAGSSLVKAAIFGNDANWGRVICAAGYSGADFDPAKVDIFLGNVQVAKDGGSLEFSEELALKALKGSTVKIMLDFKSGPFSATAWGCDLSYDYIKINADYRT
ncbi:bifunctional glutamate N-acetyltransferase/amino-acid acetyltransferase ArgJ [Pelotomaculum propionicicum]|uniref:Arginine biosynthesis bifunctional protein ArgJ n=1 Tax=Pelotomaculum propionicicum TaxID=258475 RepID=A0A4Y7RWE3_9FIRM|nr:bifunctional glutamate N-acetyltransferase/amino-acid acetyltransferase ArgJ [Pelotomaculum propionicicum]TEB13221.1 Arginine biosynthesis bifunctional protein ArgJ [Pelotomaculum propionicicum]